METIARLKRIRISELLATGQAGTEVNIKGWVRTRRGNKSVEFIVLNDGSTIHNVQIVADLEGGFDVEKLKNIHTGSCLSVTGQVVESIGSGQKLEIKALDIEVYGTCDPEKYPLQPKEHSMEFLREHAHLRFRTNTFGAVFRIRHAMAFAVHKYFNDKGFFYLHTPIITGSDCEGAGEMFRVSTFNPLQVPKNDEGAVDWKNDFFGKEVKLTVSGQLEGELGAMALGQIYTFGPTFRAENSNTARHLAEFWMIEPEVAFNDITDNMDLAEDFLQYLVKYALENCKDDLDFLAKRFEKEEEKKKKEDRSEMGLLEKLRFVMENSFERLTFYVSFSWTIFLSSLCARARSSASVVATPSMRASNNFPKIVVYCGPGCNPIA